MPDLQNAYPSLTLDDVCDFLAKKENTVILFHARPDGDAVGSAFALRGLLTAMGMRAYCLCADELPHRLAFLAASQTSALAESLPADFAPYRVVSVDTASPAQLGALADSFCALTQLMIDHHGIGVPYAPGWIVPDAAATGELIFRVSRELLRRGILSEIPLAVDEAIFAAIVSDTGSFKYSNTTSETFLCAAELVRHGVDSAKINHSLFESRPYELLRTEHIGFEQLRFFDGGKIALLPLSYEVKEKNGIQNEYTDTLVDIARVIEGVVLSVSLRQPAPEGKFRLSTRSSGNFDVAALCAAFGGGGHVKAAGATIEAPDMETAIGMVLAEIEKQKKLQKLI